MKWHRGEPRHRHPGRILAAAGFYLLVAAIFVGCAVPAPTTVPAAAVKSQTGVRDTATAPKSQAAARNTATPARRSFATTAAPKAGTKTPVTGLAAGASQLADGLVLATPAPGDRMPTIGYDRLPPQGRDTLVLIADGGPFKYRQDGVVFQNREGLLPRKSSGYYHEYTVITPGSPDRGARRIIRGAQNETYYTDDHYASFKRVVQ